MAKLMTEVAIDYIELAHEVNELADRYGHYLPPPDRGWIESDIRDLAGRVEDLAYYWEPDIAALLMAARIAEQEEHLKTGWRWSLALISMSYDLIDKTVDESKKLGLSRAAAARTISRSTLLELAEKYADELPVKTLGKVATWLGFALDVYEYWEESRQFDEALAKAALPAGLGAGLGAAARVLCGLGTVNVWVRGGCFVGGSVVGAFLGRRGVEYYERRFEDN